MKAKELEELPEWNFNERYDNMFKELSKEQKALVVQASINCFKKGIDHAYELFDKAIQKDKSNMEKDNAFSLNEKGHIMYND
ncbi:MAG: hypothetical protein GY782_00990 [Gammaproteobacteria bacterium]|nr:hypothetical protein [Gammaproteobacteria bacterium]